MATLHIANILLLTPSTSPIHCCLLYHIFQFEVSRAAAAFIFNAFYVHFAHFSKDTHTTREGAYVSAQYLLNEKLNPFTWHWFQIEIYCFAGRELKEIYKLILSFACLKENTTSSYWGICRLHLIVARLNNHKMLYIFF